MRSSLGAGLLLGMMWPALWSSPLLAQARESSSEALPVLPDQAQRAALEKILPGLKSADAEQVALSLRELGRLGDLRAYRPILDTLARRKEEPVREAGLSALEKLRYTPDFLVKVLQTPSEPALARAYAAYTLGLMQSRDAVPALIEALQAPEEEVRDRAIEALGRTQDPRGWKPLILVANKDASPELRRKAQKTVESLTAMGGNAGLDAESLNLQLKDPDPYRRREAAQALAKRGNWWSIQPLIQALDDVDAEVRRYAARALGDRQDRRAVDPLIQFAQRSRGIERYTALAALAVLKDDTAVDALSSLSKDPDAESRRYAARALGAIASARGGPALLGMLEDINPENRYEAARSLGLVREATAIPRLVRMVKEEKESLQIEATRAIGRIGGEDALQALIPILRHDNPMVVVAAVIAVKTVGLAGGIAPLEQLAKKHSEVLVKEEALEALVELKGGIQRKAAGVGPMPTSP